MHALKESEGKRGENKMNIYQNAANQATEESNGSLSERRLWTAVLLQALEDWQSGNMRRRKEAEKFLFESSEDFSRVCRAAGLDPTGVLSRLRRMSNTTSQPSFQIQRAA